MAGPVAQVSGGLPTVGAVDPGCSRWTARSAWGAGPRSARVASVLTVVALAAGIALSDVGIPSAVGIAAMLPAALVDVVDRRLPDRLVLAAGGWFAGATLVVSAFDGFSRPPDLAAAALGAGMMAGPLLALHLVSPTSMGFGDVKAAVVLGCALGTVHPQLPLVGLLLACGATAVVGLLGRRRSLPFGPGLVAGSACALLTSNTWIGAFS